MAKKKPTPEPQEASEEALGALTLAESQELTRLEHIVHKGQSTFVEVATALLEIRDKRLYRLSNKTWPGYCSERWNFSGRYANKLIETLDVVDAAKKSGTMVPESERQAREVLTEAKAAATPEKPVASQLGDILERRRRQIAEAEAQARRDTPVSPPRDAAKDGLDAIRGHLAKCVKIFARIKLDLANPDQGELKLLDAVQEWDSQQVIDRTGKEAA